MKMMPVNEEILKKMFDEWNREMESNKNQPTLTAEILANPEAPPVAKIANPTAK
jgi:hypothetical protein